jgi:hypothetical protein
MSVKALIDSLRREFLACHAEAGMKPEAIRMTA